MNQAREEWVWTFFILISIILPGWLKKIIIGKHIACMASSWFFITSFLFLPSRTNSVHLCSWSMQRKKIHIYGRKRWEFSTFNCYSKMFNIRMIHSTMDEVELDVVIQRVDTTFHWINHCLVDDSGNLNRNYL